MVLILDEHSEIGARVGRDLGYLPSVRHLIKSQIKIGIIFPKRSIFRHMCETCSKLPSQKSTIASTVFRSL